MCCCLRAGSLATRCICFSILFNVAFDETIDFYLQHEFVSVRTKSLSQSVMQSRDK